MIDMRVPVLVAAIPAVLMVSAAAARADTRDLSASGSGLLVASPCARQVTVQVDPSLHDAVQVTATAAHPEELAQLSAGTVDGRARIGLRSDQTECWRPGEVVSFRPTLALTVRVPATFPVAIREAGMGSYVLGAVGPLSLYLSGSGTLTAEDARGDVGIDVSGSGDVTLARAEAPRVSVDLAGSGAVRIEGGQVGDVSVKDSGAASVRIAPSVADADVSMAGAGSVWLGGVSGQFAHSISGVGRLTVGSKTYSGLSDD